jgi:hypothetical protein
MIAFVDSPLYAGAEFALIAATFFDWLVVERRRRIAVPGSHERFVYATIRYVTCWSALAYWVVIGFDNFVHESWLWFVLDVVFGVLDYRRIRHFLDENDDNWFSRTGKRLMAGFRRWAESTTRVPAPAMS